MPPLSREPPPAPPPSLAGKYATAGLLRVRMKGGGHVRPTMTPGLVGDGDKIPVPVALDEPVPVTLDEAVSVLLSLLTSAIDRSRWRANKPPVPAVTPTQAIPSAAALAPVTISQG